MTPPGPVILAIDQSTSATKAILFDASGVALDKESRKHEQIYPQPAWVEHDADEIWRNTVEVVGALVSRNADATQRIACLSITNQRETFVVFDRATGRPLRNAVVWQCRRGEPVCAEHRAAGHEELVGRKTGLPIDTYFPASKLELLLREDGELRRALDDGSALVSTIDAYLVHRMTKGGVYATDHTNASRTLLFDIEALAWDDELCALFTVPTSALPEVRASDARFGETDIEGVLPRPVPICGVMGDSQAALFAEACFDVGDAKVTFGTGSSCLLNVGAARPAGGEGIVTALGWVLDRDEQGARCYALEGIINCTGATVSWLTDQLELLKTPVESEELARSVNDNGGVYLVPAFVGLSAPYWHADARAAIVGLTPHSTKRHVARAALESIAYQVADCLELMARTSSVTLARMHADGGMVANSFLMQFVSDMTRLQVRASSEPEVSALGAAFAGGLGVGLYESLAEVAALPRQATEYAPQMEAELVEENHQGWQRAVARVF